MENKQRKKKEPWRIVVFILSIAVIIFMWVKNDIAAIYQDMPNEQLMPLVVTTVAVSLCKVAVITVGVFLVGWIVGKIKAHHSSEGTPMDKETEGTVIKVSRQWWLKVNTKPIRTHALDGATFPYIIKVKYTVDGKEHIKRKWIHAGAAVPALDSPVRVVYSAEKPRKAKIFLI